MAVIFHVSAAIVFAIIPFLRYRNVSILKILTVVGVFLAVLNIYPIEYIIKLLSMLPTGGYIEKIKWYSQDDYAGTVLTYSLIFKLGVVFYLITGSITSDLMIQNLLIRKSMI